MRNHLKTFFILTTLNTFFSLSVQANNTQLLKRYVPNTLCNSQCAKGIPTRILKQFFDKATYIAPRKLENTTWAFVIDFSKHSSKKRGHMLNLKNGKVYSYTVSHGIHSDPSRDGNATTFSNIPGSNKSSLGLYIAAETYYGSFGYSMRLDGMESTNDNARSRAIVMHGMKGLDSEYISQKGKAALSRGCPAVTPAVSKSLIDLLKNGSLYFIGR